ncbi:MAG: Z1 domain-containing protein [Patescibacteria group bacterium]|jgi:hypothetical protein
MKINANKDYFKEVLEKIPVDEGREKSKKNALTIVREVIKIFNEFFDAKDVKKIKSSKIAAKKANGLVYGRIQSGKTRAMIASSALAIDSGFRIVIILTSNNNRLVKQTSQDFSNGAPSINVYTKDELVEDQKRIPQLLSRGKGIIIVCAKGSRVLSDVITLLNKLKISIYPTLIFDDEGDQATLDTNTNKRSVSAGNLKPSKINMLVHYDRADSIRTALPLSVFVSVTGTPQSIVLQSSESTSKVSFIKLLPAGDGYVGGETFFPGPSPDGNELVGIINEDERTELLNASKKIPEGLRESICFFIISSAIAGLQIGWPNEGYKFLCHPSVKNKDQDKVKNIIELFLIDVDKAIWGGKDVKSKEVITLLKKEYDKFVKKGKMPTFDAVINLLKEKLDSRKIHLINAKTTNQDLSYSSYLNFLIGGNTLGRGLAIKNLLVTYYTREAKVSQMDTMFQHARMFGYRKKTLLYTKVFLSELLYSRFYNISTSDFQLREYIEKYKYSEKSLLPVQTTISGMQPTRKGVINAIDVSTIVPGSQVYPDYPIFLDPDASIIKSSVFSELAIVDKKYKNANRRYKILVKTDTAIKIISLIKTKAKNRWNDSLMADFLKTAALQMGDGVYINFRESPRRQPKDENGFMPQGVLQGDEVRISASKGKPVLWITIVSATKEWKKYNAVDFIYPTLVFPKKMRLFWYNKK